MTHSIFIPIQISYQSVSPLIQSKKSKHTDPEELIPSSPARLALSNDLGILKALTAGLLPVLLLLPLLLAFRSFSATPILPMTFWSILSCRTLFSTSLRLFKMNRLAAREDFGRRRVLDFDSRTEISVSRTSIVQRARTARESVSRFRGGSVEVGREFWRFQVPEGRETRSWVSGLEYCIKFVRRVIVCWSVCVPEDQVGH
jgi:hypothetical protein